MAQAHMMVCNCSKNQMYVRTTYGSLEFTPGEPRLVAPNMVRACLAVGIQMADDQPPPIPQAVEVESEPQEHEARADLIREAILVILERNDVNDFTAGGTPKVTAIGKVAGLTKVGLSEIAPVMAELNEAKEAKRALVEKQKAQPSKTSVKGPIDESGAEDR